MHRKLAVAVASILGASAQAQTSFVCTNDVPCTFYGAYNGPTQGQIPNGINNLVVNGIVYNVTFTSYMNSPFTTIPAGMAAANAISRFVGSFSIMPDVVGPGYMIETEYGGIYNTVLSETFWGGGANDNAGTLSSPNDLPTDCSQVTCTSWVKVPISNTLVNGSLVPAYAGCDLGVDVLPNWMVANNIDVVEANCNVGIAPPVGTYYIDLTGGGAEYGMNDVGEISQTVATTIGKTYTISFYFGGNALWKLKQNPQAPTPNDGEYKALEVLVNNNVQGVFGVHTANVPYYDAQWQKESVTFTATTPFTSIGFQSLNGVVNPSDYGPLLAGVTLTH